MRNPTNRDRTPKTEGKARSRSRVWRLCRIYLRRLRITIWLVILALVGALAYLNQVGLPNVVKRPLLEKLRARGIDLQFSRLRLRWYHGIVADNVGSPARTNRSVRN